LALGNDVSKIGLNWEDHVKKLLVACSGAFLFAAGCGQSGPGTSTGSAGSSGGTTSGAAGNDSPGSGGSSNPGTAGTGNPGTAGSSNPGTAGSSNPGTAGTGNPGTAGTGNPGTAGTGNPGTAGTGNPGTAGTGNPGTAGTGNPGTAGAAGGRGGNSAGGTTGGSAGGTTGGSAAGSGGRGGGAGTATGGSAGGTGGSGCGLTPDCIVGTAPNGLDGYYWEMTPSGSTALSGTNYPFNMPNTSTCPGGAWATAGYISPKPVINVKGTTGQKYTVNINVRGVAGTRCYEMGTPASTATWVDSGPNNGWYSGGKQYNDSIWNTAEIRVAPKVTGQPNQTLNTGYDIYFANSSQNSNPSAAGTAQWWCQREATYEIGYNASFPVMGGGTITLVIHDSNCRTLGNCGPTLSQQSCDTSASRTVSMTGVSPAPTNFAQPRTFSLNGTTYEVQWLWIDVTSVTSP
jgi:hypothetical protein